MKKLLIALCLLLFIMPCSKKDNDETMTMGGEEIEVANPNNGGD